MVSSRWLPLTCGPPARCARQAGRGRRRCNGSSATPARDGRLCAGMQCRRVDGSPVATPAAIAHTCAPDPRQGAPMVSFRLPTLACALLWAASSTTIAAQAVLPVAHGYQTREAWREPVALLRLADNTWYIGTRGLTALLVKTDEGAVLRESMASVGVDPR